MQPFGVKEQAYIGLTTMIVSLIYLNGRSIAETKLDRYLRRMNADRSTAAGDTEKVLQSMIRHGYISKQKDDNANDGTFNYVLGPRGKVEIGTDGVLSMIKTVCLRLPISLRIHTDKSRSMASTSPRTSRNEWRETLDSILKLVHPRPRARIDGGRGETMALRGKLGRKMRINITWLIVQLRLLCSKKGVRERRLSDLFFQ